MAAEEATGRLPESVHLEELSDGRLMLFVTAGGDELDVVLEPEEVANLAHALVNRLPALFKARIAARAAASEGGAPPST